MPINCRITTTKKDNFKSKKNNRKTKKDNCTTKTLIVKRTVQLFDDFYRSSEGLEIKEVTLF